MAERKQINLSWTLPDENWATLEKVAQELNLQPGQVARILLEQRLDQWRDGLRFDTPMRELAVNVACMLNEKGLDRLNSFLAKTFTKEVEVKQSRPRRMVFL